MAYRFNGSSDLVEFAITPFVGYAFGAVTVAAFFKRNATGARHCWIQASDSTLGTAHFRERFENADTHIFFSGGGANSGGAYVYSSTSNWYIVATTRVAGVTLPRFHIHDGTSWTHQAASSGTAGDSLTLSGTDRLRVGTEGGGTRFFPGDIVCIGVKKATSTDVAVETLSRTLFSAWQAFGFDWLIGFDSSLEAAGILQDQGTAGTGDETAISGTSAVADPPGWVWPAGGGAAVYVPQVAIVG